MCAVNYSKGHNFASLRMINSWTVK